MNQFPIPIFSAAFVALACQLSAAEPSWWATRGVTNNSPESNLSPAAIGQAKHVVAMALAELQPILDESTFQALQSDVAAIVSLAVPTMPADIETQRAVLLVGQLKAISAPFYLKLHNSSPAWLERQLVENLTKDPSDSGNFYPWTSNASDDTNKAIATIGQLKAVFSLRFEADADHNGLPDLWESIWFGQTGEDPDLDSDGDGLTNAQENLHGTDPHLADSDGDGLTDFEEVQNGGRPLIHGIWAFKEIQNTDGTVTFTWNSHAQNGDWFHIENKQTDGTWKSVFSTTYGSAILPFVTDTLSYSLTLNPATDYAP